PVQVMSDEWYDRFMRADSSNPAVPRTVTWQVEGAGARVNPVSQQKTNGSFETVLETGTNANETREVVVKIGDVVMGKAGPVAIEPGKAAKVEVKAEGDRLSVPADGATEVLLTATVTDRAGNLVADGTAVIWHTEEEGSLIEPQEATQNGKATVRFRAGSHLYQRATIQALVDEVVGEVQLQQETIEMELLARSEIGLTENLEIEVRAHSNGGVISDKAALDFWSNIGRITVTSPLKDGIAKALWSSVPGVSYRPA